MAKDLTKAIEELRCSAVGRCRERLDQAAQKAKAILKKGQPEKQMERPPCGDEKYGVTSLLKRRHGL